jgi:hypothetical protein
MSAVQAKLTSVQGGGTWEGKYGTMYQFIVIVEEPSGIETVGSVNAKSSDPKWMALQGTDQPVWFERIGEHNGTAKLKLSATDPAQARPRGNDPETSKRIENSWAVQTAIQIMGPLSEYQEGVDSYLKYVFELAPRLKKMRDKLGEQ